jgi:hypothetical protein
MENNHTKEKEQQISDQIAGHLASSWLPSGLTRKIILFVFVILAFKYFMQSDYLVTLIMLILASLFSPRAMGEVVNFIGKIVGSINRTFK